MTAPASHKYATSDYIVVIDEDVASGKRVYKVRHRDDDVTALVLTQLPAAIVAAQALQEDLDKVMAEVRGDIATPQSPRAN